MKKLLLFSLLLAFTVPSYSQSDKDLAYNKCMKAIYLMENGQIKESVSLLNEAMKLDPYNIDYPYEMAYACYLGKDYKKSVKILSELSSRPDVNFRIYQLLGNSYDMAGKKPKALEAYREGIQKFPDKGNLYYDMGIAYLGAKDYDNAIASFESGVKADPNYCSNYFLLTLIYCGSTEEVWGMIYGELMMLLERNTKKTEKVSTILFNTYKSQITFNSDTSISVSFCKGATMNVNDVSSGKLPFGLLVYEPLLMLSLVKEKSITLESLNRIRTRFLEEYLNKGYDKKYNNPLFDLQYKAFKAGHFEAYNYWVLQYGDPDEFDFWRKNNQVKWSNFISWFMDNTLELSQRYRFVKPD